MSTAPQLLDLPPEILVIILDGLYELRNLPPGNLGRFYFGYDITNRATSFLSILHLRSVSVVNHRLRTLCLPLLFKVIRCSGSKTLEQLDADCTANPDFARLIRRLDLLKSNPGETLYALLPRLISLTWLGIEDFHMDAKLLAMANAHHALATVAVHKLIKIEALTELLQTTSETFSKILFAETILGHVTIKAIPAIAKAISPAIARGARFAYVAMIEGSDFGQESRGLSLPGLEQLDLMPPYQPSVPIMTWLPDFIRRHTHLTTMKFFGNRWQDHPDIPFAPQFAREVAQSSTGARLRSFSLAPVPSWTSLNEWKLVHLELKVGTQYAITAALEAVGMLAPRLPSLMLQADELGFHVPIHIDFLAKSFDQLTTSALRTLHLINFYRCLDNHGQSPWLSTERAARKTLGTSQCVMAHSAMLWYMGRVAERVPSLELIQVNDAGEDGKGRFRRPWSLDASYRMRIDGVHALEALAPLLQMDSRFLPKKSGR
ncbi:hypothetical protein B0H15DRAFT_980605 [Mycena belliarum]|uniref:Uncharacterized protein n=1 Tax=Mycena belliarum TaxID=1033014 RepID=A0AAD6XMW8_9AGAR|nr:hypothetical protein B0H15DRAFT_980605 [Mycena belliae]